LIARLGELSGNVPAMMRAETTAELLHKMSKELANKRALLIDRYPNARNSLRIMLSALGVTSVHNAGTSAEVLRQVRATFRHHPLRLPARGRTRWPATARRAAPATPGAASDGLHADYQRTRLSQRRLDRRAGPDDYLIKPFTADDLHGRLVRALYSKQFFARSTSISTTALSATHWTPANAARSG
jgi:CheY-like chemotaxis protein